MTPDKYCQEKTAKSGSSFYYSFLFLPLEQRRAITALYAFCREVDDIVDECNEPAVAAAKLGWWREEIKHTFQGNPSHPVTKALSPFLESRNLPEEYFQEIIDGMQMDLEFDAYPSFKELSLYCYRVAGVVGLLAAEIFGYQNRRTPQYAHYLGIAFQLTNILRDVREDADRGRMYIPLDELEEFKVKPEDLRVGISSSKTHELFAHQAQRAQDYYRRAFDSLPDEDRYPQRSGIIMAEIYQALLKEIEDDGFRVLEQRTSLTPLRKFWLAWRTSRRERKYR